jgi:hypothetical protein
VTSEYEKLHGMRFMKLLILYNYSLVSHVFVFTAKVMCNKRKKKCREKDNGVFIVYY